MQGSGNQHKKNNIVKKQTNQKKKLSNKNEPLMRTKKQELVALLIEKL